MLYSQVILQNSISIQYMIYLITLTSPVSIPNYEEITVQHWEIHRYTNGYRFRGPWGNRRDAATRSVATSVTRECRGTCWVSTWCLTTTAGRRGPATLKLRVLCWTTSTVWCARRPSSVALASFTATPSRASSSTGPPKSTSVLTAR